MPLDIPPPRGSPFGSPLVLRRVHWVRRELVAEVKFLTWTEDNLLQQVVYEGRREDKPAAEVRREVPYTKPQRVALFAGTQRPSAPEDQVCVSWQGSAAQERPKRDPDGEACQLAARRQRCDLPHDEFEVAPGEMSLVKTAAG